MSGRLSFAFLSAVAATALLAGWSPPATAPLSLELDPGVTALGRGERRRVEKLVGSLREAWTAGDSARFAGCFDLAAAADLRARLRRGGDGDPLAIAIAGAGRDGDAGRCEAMRRGLGGRARELLPRPRPWSERATLMLVDGGGRRVVPGAEGTQATAGPGLSGLGDSGVELLIVSLLADLPADAPPVDAFLPPPAAAARAACAVPGPLRFDLGVWATDAEVDAWRDSVLAADHRFAAAGRVKRELIGRGLSILGRRARALQGAWEEWRRQELADAGPLMRQAGAPAPPACRLANRAVLRLVFVNAGGKRWRLALALVTRFAPRDPADAAALPGWEGWLERYGEWHARHLARRGGEARAAGGVRN